MTLAQAKTAQTAIVRNLYNAAMRLGISVSGITIPTDAVTFSAIMARATTCHHCLVTGRYAATDTIGSKIAPLTDTSGVQHDMSVVDFIGLAANYEVSVGNLRGARDQLFASISAAATITAVQAIIWVAPATPSSLSMTAGYAAFLNIAEGANIGVPYGIATLDTSGQLTAAQIPSSLLTGSEFQGLWNAATNSPSIASGVGTTGDYWFVSVAGTTSIDGHSAWDLNDEIIFDGVKWDRIPAPTASVGTGVVDFGSTPTTKTAVAVIPAAQVIASSLIGAFVMADDSTSTNTANAHQVAGALMRLTCGVRVPGVSFSVFADPLWGKVNGQFRFCWTIG